ncbi:MAG: hypothetical protein E7149_00070 [Rikenellaceae bacterium]|nr:hypothetical protein [Rikenellaceae bacterium]
MSNTLKRRSILPAWWWITLTGLPVLLFLDLIPEVKELMSIHITLSSGGWSLIKILYEIVNIATLILLLLPLFMKKIHLNIPARIGLIIYIVGDIISWLLFYIYYIFELDPERNFFEIEQIARTCISISNLFSWLLFVWSICAHWTLKVVLTAKLLFAYLIIFFDFTLLVGWFDCNYGEVAVIQNLIPNINYFMAFAATTLIVLIAQPKQPVAATDEPTQIE